MYLHGTLMYLQDVLPDTFTSWKLKQIYRPIVTLINNIIWFFALNERLI